MTTHLTFRFRPAVIGLLMTTMLSACASSNRSTGTLTGRVFDRWGNFIDTGGVEFHTLSDVSAATDSLGFFVIDSIPAGEHIVSGHAWGYEFDLAFIRIAAGDSVRRDFRLFVESPMIAGGGDLPIPDDEELLADATALIPEILSSLSVRDLVAESDSIRSPSVVWAPWALQNGSALTKDSVRLDFTSDCAACVGEHIPGVIESPFYRSGVDHILLGVVLSPAEATILHFCADPVGERQFGHYNCTGGWPFATFARMKDGSWKRMFGKCRPLLNRPNIPCAWM